ncbi:DUF488 family protein [Actinomadura sp. DC4]|uniref:DUF488 domain-containing protein n=1 Tax=Actinomadura sp. DC4 TaxID=3055069 RepID=UPI0025B21E43|nr:DUF488 family protein [Actinomadura sp. DC4]MDN3356286.1 DUF488 family protein [Actinomadura sp. DC4]
MAPQVTVVRIYEDQAKTPGTRVLVDRVWPRGISKEAAHLDLWLKDVAPSTALRQWYGHDPAKFEEFRRRYEGELIEPRGSEALRRLRDLAASPLVLVTATKDVPHSQAAVLADLLSSDLTL